MSKKLKAFGIVSLFTIAVAYLFMMGSVDVYGSGTSELEIYVTNESKEGWADHGSSFEPWSTCVNSDNGRMYLTGGYTESTVGWMSGTVHENEWQLYEGLLGFNTANLTEGVEIASAYIELYVESKVNQGGWPAYFSLYKGTPGEDFTWDSEDWDNAYDVGAHRVGHVEDYDDIGTGEYHRFDILDSWLDYVSDADENEYVWFYVATTNHMLNYAPDWEGLVKALNIQYHAYNNTYRPRLVIEYIQDTLERELEVPENDPVDPDPDPSAVADNVTWESPRCSYADEGMYLRINGDSGASISVQLVDDDGNVLDDFENSIRTDGDYDYNPDLPDSWFGWVRVLELNFNLSSEWGYVMPVPDADQAGNTLYAVNTEYPQYNFLFSRYLTFENDMFVVHWKTNIQDGESGNHTLEIWGNSDNETSVMFSSNFTALNDNYFKANSDNDHLSHWRYMIFTPNIEGAGFETYDDLVYDLDQNYSISTAGYLHAVILDTSANSTLADSHSCYWYIPDIQDGLIFQLNSVEYKQSGDIELKIQVGSACKILDNLSSLKVQIIDDTGAVISTNYESYTSGLNEYIITAPAATGNYEVRFTFSGDSTWSYIHDRPFKVSVKGALTGGDVADAIDNWISNLGMDNPAGYWIVTMLGMILLFLLAYKSALMRIVLPLGLLGFMIIQNYLDAWIIILLALGAGITLFGLFRKKIQGSGGQG